MGKIEKAKDLNSSSWAIHDSEIAYFNQKARKDLQELEKGKWIVDTDVHQNTLKLWSFDKGLKGKKVLECGCGTGFFSVLLAKIGAEVWCFDLSPQQVEITRKRAYLNDVNEKISAKVSAFEDLDYETESFDLVVGKNILHHIPDIKDAGRQIRRILKKGGKAIFYELSANNPILIFFRNHVIGKGRFIPKLGTSDEHPLTKDEVDALSAIFDGRCKISHPKFRFFGKLDRQVLKQRYRFLSLFLEAMDNMIYIFFPPLRKYSYKILLEFTNPNTSAN